MSNYGVKVSRIGYDAKDASDRQLSFSSEWPLLPIEAEGEQNVSADTEPTDVTLYTHGLGYAPVFSIERISGTIYFMPLQTYCDDTHIWVTVLPGDNFTVKWKVYRRPIETTYSAPNIDVTDATQGLDNDYGLLVSLKGKDIHSTDKGDFSIRSDVRQLMVAKSDYVNQDVTNGMSITHDLGYKPMYLAYIGVYDSPHTFRGASEADDLHISFTTTTGSITLYGYPWPAFAYILFKDTLTANG